MEFNANVQSFNGDDELVSEDNFSFDICFDLDDDADFDEDEAVEAFFTADFEL